MEYVEALERLQQLIAQGFYRATPCETNRGPLPSTLADIFSIHQTVRDQMGTKYSPVTGAPPGFVKLAWLDEDTDLIADLKDGVVFEVERGTEPLDDEDGYPSLAHYLVLVGTRR